MEMNKLIVCCFCLLLVACGGSEAPASAPDSDEPCPAPVGVAAPTRPTYRAPVATPPSHQTDTSSFRVFIGMDSHVASSTVIGSARHHSSIGFELVPDLVGDTRGTLEDLIVDANVVIAYPGGRTIRIDLDDMVTTCTLNRDDVEIASAQMIGSQVRFTNLHLPVFHSAPLEMRCNYEPQYQLGAGQSVTVRYGVPWRNGARLAEPNGLIEADLNLDQNRLEREHGAVVVTILPGF